MLSVVREKTLKSTHFSNEEQNVVDNEYQRSLLNVPGNIKVISEKQFFAQDTTTDVSKNEYVLLLVLGYMLNLCAEVQELAFQNGDILCSCVAI